ncbi:MAG: hypothetical protein BWX47_01840 [candidate division Hyd24-12 bacterium ADurb.Bin004]|nr:MAG: hypothetical protein BWX47_01840 [candidate division Hyd24-12 bacterium ADurb.Bin004]
MHCRPGGGAGDQGLVDVAPRRRHRRLSEGTGGAVPVEEPRRREVVRGVAAYEGADHDRHVRGLVGSCGSVVDPEHLRIRDAHGAAVEGVGVEPFAVVETDDVVSRKGGPVGRQGRRIVAGVPGRHIDPVVQDQAVGIALRAAGIHPEHLVGRTVRARHPPDQVGDGFERRIVLVGRRHLEDQYPVGRQQLAPAVYVVDIGRLRVLGGEVVVHAAVEEHLGIHPVLACRVFVDHHGGGHGHAEAGGHVVAAGVDDVGRVDGNAPGAAQRDREAVVVGPGPVVVEVKDPCGAVGVHQEPRAVVPHPDGVGGRSHETHVRHVHALRRERGRDTGLLRRLADHPHPGVVGEVDDHAVGKPQGPADQDARHRLELAGAPDALAGRRGSRVVGADLVEPQQFLFGEADREQFLGSADRRLCVCRECHEG